MAESEAGRSDGSSGPGPVAWLFLVLMVLITSTTATSAKFAVRELPVALLPLVRFGVAGLCLLPVTLRGGALSRLLREDLGRLALAAALCVPINQTVFPYGARLRPPAVTPPDSAAVPGAV